MHEPGRRSILQQGRLYGKSSGQSVCNSKLACLLELSDGKGCKRDDLLWRLRAQSCNNSKTTRLSKMYPRKDCRIQNK